MHKRALAVYLTTALLAFPGRLPAQQAAAAETDPVFRTESRLVVLHATALDKQERLLLDLPKSAFQVYENGVRQDIKTFRREDVPVSLGLIIDSSASMRDKRERVKASALDLIKSSNPDDEVFVVNFSDAPSLDADFTNDVPALTKALSRIDSRGGTAMRDALREAIEHVKGRNKKDKKVLLVVTDGDDNASYVTLDYLVKAAQKNEVLVYAIGLFGDQSDREIERARKALDTLTSATGGQAYYPNSVSEIDGVAPRIAHEIRGQYILAYTPANQVLDRTFRQIRVLVDFPAGTTVRTRSGYYATPE